MRVAIIALFALATVAGTAPAASACPLESGGPVEQVIAAAGGAAGAVGEMLGLTSPAPPPGGAGTTSNSTSNTTTTNTFVTNNFITNGATQGTGTQGATTAGITPFTFGGGGGGIGGGGGGMGGGFGGGFGGGTTVGGMPYNPSNDYVYQPYAGGGTNGGGGGVFFADPSAVAATAGGQTGNASFAMASAPDSTDGPLTAGVTMAALPTPASGDDSFPAALASPRTDGAASPGSSGFGFEGPAQPAAPIASAFGGTTFLAALIGIGVLGAGWAWRAFVV